MNHNSQGRAVKVGDRASLSKRFSQQDVAIFAEISGDRNPIHLDEQYAAQTRFGGRIVHGMLTSGLISAVLGTELPGPGAIYLSQTLKFLAPVRVGATVTAEVEVTAVRDDKPVVTLRTRCRSDAGEIVIDGEAVLLLPAGPRDGTP